MPKPFGSLIDRFVRAECRAALKPRALQRRLRFEELETRQMLSGGRPLPPGVVGDNVARGAPYAWSSAPNAAGCTDAADASQLTDGQSTTGLFWSQATTVGWESCTAPIEITLDLGQVQPIQGVAYSTAAGAAGVAWPTAIRVAVSNDNRNFYTVADLVALDPNPPLPDVYAIHRYEVTDQLATHGRWVRFQVENPTVYVDEIEVYRGADALLGQNLAVGSPYTLSPAPNYSYCTEPGDATQLTDGLYTHGYFWTQVSTVGWQSPHSSAQIRIDLGADQPIEGLSFNTAAGVAGVVWPSAIGILVSSDGVNYFDAGELTSLSVEHGLPPSEGYLVRSYWTDRLVTHGRYVKIVAVDAPFLFCDEIEVYRGRDEFLALPFEGAPVTDMAGYINTSQQHAMGIRRIVVDAQDVAQRVGASVELTPGEQAGLLEQLADYIDQAMYDEPAQVVLPLDDLHRQVYAAQAALWRAEGVADLTAWGTDTPWDQILPTQSPSKGVAPRVDVTLMQNEYRAAAFNLSNATPSELEVSLAIVGLPGGTNPSYVTVAEAEWTDTKTGTPHLAALPEATYDIARQAYLIHVPAGMTRQLWLTFHPGSDTGAGIYTGTIVADGGAAGAASIPLSMRVSGLVFPSQPALGLGGWDYTNTTYGQVTAANREAFITTLTEHFVDTTWATNAVMPSTPDFTQFDAWVARWPNARQYRIFSNVAATFGGYALGTAEFNQAVGAWISAYVSHWRGLGIEPSQVGLLLLDEPHEAAQAERIVAWASAIQAAEPEVSIWEDPTYSTPSDGTAMFSVCDVLCPNRPMFLAGSDTFRETYRQQRDAGRTLNFYSCSGPTEKLDPYTYYRLQAWTCWDEWGRLRDGSTAMFYWAFPDQGGAASWRTSYGTRPNYTPLFLDASTVTDGKDLEAIREGIEDYEYLYLLKQRIAELEAQGVPASALGAATALLASAPSSVLDAAAASDLTWAHAKDRSVADAVRVQVLDMLERLAQVSPSAHLDVDGNGAADALTDGILALRYLFDPSGDWNVADALGAGATRTTRQEIHAFLDGARMTVLDADGNGAADALTDGILILRYLFDPPGEWNYADALGAGASRLDRTEIRAFLDLCQPHSDTGPSSTAALDETLAAPLASSSLACAAPRTSTAAQDAVLRQWRQRVARQAALLHARNHGCAAGDDLWGARNLRHS